MEINGMIYVEGKEELRNVDLEYMIMDLYCIEMMKDQQIETLKKENEQLKKQIDELVYENSKLGEFNIHMYVREQDKLMRENEQLRRDNNEEVLTLAKEKARLKDLLVEKDKQIKNWSQSYGELCNINEEQTKEIFRLREANNNQEKIIKKQENTIDEIVEARYNLEDELSIAKYDLGNLKIKLKTTQEEKTTMAKDLDIFIDTIKQLDKKLQVAMKDNKAYESRIKKLEQKIFDEQLDRVGECAKCSHSGCATCKTNPPCECDTESKSMVDDCSVDCRPRKQ